MICILMVGLLLNASLLTAREIRQERFSLLCQTVRLADRETFVLTGTPNHRQPSCVERVTKAKDGCELPVAHFHLGSAELSQAEQTLMLAALAQCTIVPEAGLIVTGHTCLLGTEERNRTLSQERAEQVALLLRAHGYTVSEVASRGSQQPLPGIELARNRRVDIAVIQP